uniref:Homeobox domain-containing protein n=1 Tax=Globodera rostochiensis TaxID=31243 RepID=A0A914HB90_GLORO
MNDSVGSKTELSDFSSRPCNPSGAFASADPLHCLEQISNLPENGLGPNHHNPGSAAAFPTVAPNYGQYHQLACAYAASLQFGQFVANGNVDPSTGIGCVKKSSGRQTYTPDQKRRLEEMFQSSAYVSKAQRQHLADVTKLSDKQIKIWFQNRRMKRKKQETGVGQQSQHHQGDGGASTSPSQQQSPADSSFMAVEANGVKSEPENGGCGGGEQHHHMHGTPLVFKADPRGTKVDSEHPQQGPSIHPLGTVPQPHGTCLPSATAPPLTAMPFFNYYQYGGTGYGQHLSSYYPTSMFGMNTAAQTATWPGMEGGNGYIRGQL